MLVGIKSGQADVGRGQRPHAAALGITRRVDLLVDGLHRADDGAGDGYRQTALAGALLDALLAALSGFVEGHRLRADVDITPWGQHVAAGLGVGLACVQVHVAAHAAHGTGGSGGLLVLLVQALLLLAQGDAQAAAHEAASSGFVEAAAAAEGAAEDAAEGQLDVACTDGTMAFVRAWAINATFSQT